MHLGHTLEGLMERKLNEFPALTQGTRTVLQYAEVTNLSQYAGYHADTDSKKHDRFRRGQYQAQGTSKSHQNGHLQ
jgi:hypothetical protein